ncbi:MAG: class I SAM-dependent methyltransferase [Blastocatellia bacterium]
MNFLERLHHTYIFPRRIQALSHHLTALLPPQASVLDVGCGDGLLAHTMQQQRPDLTIKGVEVLVRPQTRIPVRAYDGQRLPYADQSFDAVLFVDVLHHTTDPRQLLREAARVSRSFIVIKDHTRKGWLADATLRWMDDVGNARHGVGRTYNYWAEEQWHAAYAELALQVQVWQNRLHLYPWPASWWFDRSLHFVTQLAVSKHLL